MTGMTRRGDEAQSSGAPAHGRSAARTLHALVCAAVLGCSACTASTGDGRGDEPIAVSQSAIVSGAIVDAEYSGMVMLEDAFFDAGFCSGVLYTNQIVVTAKHCIVDGETETDYRKRPRDIYARMGSQRIRASAVRIHAPENAISLDDDVALLKLEAGMSMRSAAGQLSTSGYKRPEYTGTAEALTGKTLLCLGYGWSVQEQTAPLDGQLRSASLVATYVAEGTPDSPGRRLRTDVNSEQIQSHGDSGGPCLDGTTLDSPIAAITSVSDYCTVSIAWSDAWPEYKDWVNATYPQM